MKLHSKRKPAHNIPHTRETKAIVQAFIKAAHEADTSASQGLVQLLEQYVDKPFDFMPGISPGTKDAQFKSIRVEDDTARQLRRHAKRHGIKVPEAIRQIVRRYLAQEGRLPR